MSEGGLLSWWRRSPLTDPRSILGSTVLHAIVLVVLGTIVAATVPRTAPPESKALTAELGPIDNKVTSERPGGSPLEDGGEGTIAVEVKGPDGDRATSAAVPDAIRDLVAGVGGMPQGPPINAAPLPSATGTGLVPGLGPGGGEGSGGGSRGGVGTGLGPATEFFGVRDAARSFAFVIDKSGSMARSQSLDVAKGELLASLDRLTPDVRFGVVFYELRSHSFPNPSGEAALMAANDANKARLRAFLRTLSPFGGTDHMKALRTGLALKSEVLYFLTDADQMTDQDADDVLKDVGDTRVQAIEFGVGPSMTRANPLRRLAAVTGGTYRHVDVTTFGK